MVFPKERRGSARKHNPDTLRSLVNNALMGLVTHIGDSQSKVNPVTRLRVRSVYGEAKQSRALEHASEVEPSDSRTAEMADQSLNP